MFHWPLNPEISVHPITALSTRRSPGCLAQGAPSHLYPETFSCQWAERCKSEPENIAHVRKMYSPGAWYGKVPRSPGVHPKKHLRVCLKLQFSLKYVSSSIAFDWHWINKMWEVINKFIEWRQYLAEVWTSVFRFLNKEKESVCGECNLVGNAFHTGIFQTDTVTQWHKSMNIFLMLEQKRNVLNRYIHINKSRSSAYWLL